MTYFCVLRYESQRKVVWLSALLYKSGYNPVAARIYMSFAPVQVNNFRYSGQLGGCGNPKGHSECTKKDTGSIDEKVS